MSKSSKSSKKGHTKSASVEEGEPAPIAHKSNSAKAEEPAPIAHKSNSAINPSIITITIISHGRDIPREPYSNPDVRILSIAGRSGSITHSAPNTLKIITDEFDEHYLEYSRNIPSKGKKKFVEQLYSDYPMANKSKGIPDFVFDAEGNAAPLSTYTFLSEVFLSDRGKRLDLDRMMASKSSYRDYSKSQPIRQGHHRESDTQTRADAESGLTHRMYTPVINKRYFFLSNPDNPEQASNLKFGIYVMAISNYDKTNIKVGDNLMTSKSAVNRDFVRYMTDQDNIITMKDVCQHLRKCGFDVINIIDTSCRECIEEEFLESDTAMAGSHSRAEVSRRRITRHEDTAKETMNTAVGGYTYKKSKSKSNNRSKSKRISREAK